MRKTRLNQELILKLMSLCAIAYLCFYYRQGGIKDTGIEVPNLRDVGVYIDAGRAVLNGLNPYSTVGSRFGDLGPIPIAILSYVVPFKFTTLFFQLINLICVYYFINVFGNLYGTKNRDLIFLTCLFIAPTREMLVTNQVTGMLMGLIALGYSLYLHAIKTGTFPTLILSGLMFAVAGDLKPHIVGVFLLCLAANSRTYKLLIVTASSWLVGHLVIDLSQRRILEKDWLESMRSLQERSSQGKLGDSVSFWPWIYKLLNVEGLPGILTTLPITLALIACIVISRRKEFKSIIPWAFLVPSLSIYFHFYDAVPIFVIILIMLRLNVDGSILALIAFLLIPKEYLEIKNQLLIIFFMILWIYFSKRPHSFLKIPAVYISVNMLHILNSFLTKDEYLLQSLVVSESLIMAAFLAYKLTVELSKFENGVENSGTT